MRTTVRLEGDLLRAAKKLAADTNRTLTSVIEDALREVLARRRAPRKRSRVHLPIVRGGGILAGVDLDDTASLVALMERSDEAS